jgi:N-glycosylase/DNA lyase
MLITFIISQRKNIPAISKAVDTLAQKFGGKIMTGYETVSVFPTPEELCLAQTEELNSCGLGYRAAYVKDATEKVKTRALDLTELASRQDNDLFEELMKIHGVGKKVANCVCLFGYGRTARVPVDVWIARAIQEECHGESPFADLGEEAGIIQQYVFYYERNYRRQH